MTTYDALHLSRGWLSVALASTKADNFVLDRTICIEQYPDGLRLIATDSYMLLHAWVPMLDVEHPEPGWDEVPDEQHIAFDGDGRGKNLMQYMHGICTAKDAPRYEMALRPSKVYDGDGQGMFDGFAATAIQLEFPGVEKVTLAVVEANYPNWRKTLADGFKPVRTDAVALHTERLTALAKLGKLHTGPVLWRFGGRDKMAMIEVGDSDPRVAGAVMPVRWDFDRAMPADNVPQGDES